MSMKKIEINGIILAGGLSSRMGTDKGLMLLNDQTMVENLYARLAPICKSVIVVTNKPEDYQPVIDRIIRTNNLILTSLQDLPMRTMPKITIVTDIIKQLGPLSGIHAGLNASDTDYNMVVACDMPNANPAKFIEFSRPMMAEGKQIIVAQDLDGKYHSLHAIYHKSCQQIIENQLLEKNLRIKQLLNLTDTYVIPINQIGEEMFFNMNTPNDYKQILGNEIDN